MTSSLFLGGIGHLKAGWSVLVQNVQGQGLFVRSPNGTRFCTLAWFGLGVVERIGPALLLVGLGVDFGG